MKIKELQTILEHQPSVAGNTFLVILLYVLSWVFAVGFLVLGLGLLLESAFHFKIFLEWVSRNLHLILNDEQRWKIASSLGLLSLVLGGVFTGFIFLCRMILNRNRFILEIEDWIFQNISEIRKPKRK